MKMAATGEHQVKQRKPDAERQMLHRSSRLGILDLVYKPDYVYMTLKQKWDCGKDGEQ